MSDNNNNAGYSDRLASRTARFGPAPSSTTTSAPPPQQQQQSYNNYQQQPRYSGGYHNDNNNSRVGYGGHRRGGYHHQQQYNNNNNYHGGYNNNYNQQQQHAAYAHHHVTGPSHAGAGASYRRPHQPGAASSRYSHHDRNRKPMSSYDEKCAVRIGVVDAKRAITEQDIMNDIEHIRLSSKIEAIFIESASSLRSSPDSSLERMDSEEEKEKKAKEEQGEDKKQEDNASNEVKPILTEINEGQPTVDPQTGKSIQWARVFMSNPDVADECAAEFAFPGAQFRWRLIVQRLPIVDHYTALMKKVNNNATNSGINPTIANNIYHPLQNCPIPQVIVVDTQEGYVPFMTTELFHTKGTTDYLLAKETKNHLLRRMVCKHYDPHNQTDCFFGTNCSFVHLHTPCFERLLRIQSFKTRLRTPVGRRPEDAIQSCNWEVERRQDTLVVRDLPESVGEEQVNYMFSGCGGFISAKVRHTPYEGRRYGVVRFNSRADATTAMAQTFGSGLNVCFFGVLEDLRGIRIKEKLQEDEQERLRIQKEKEERHAFLAKRREELAAQKQQQQVDDSSSSATGGYTSKKFGGGGDESNNNSSTTDNLKNTKESGQRRQREGEESSSHQNKSTTNDKNAFANEVLELRQSDSDNDDDDHEGSSNNDSDNDDRNQNENGRYSRSNSPSSPSDDDDDEEKDVNNSTEDATVADDTEPNSEVAQPINLAKPTADDFPALPDGWDWGFTRKLNRYYFFETLKRNKTSWKHPVTNKSYATGGVEC